MNDGKSSSRIETSAKTQNEGSTSRSGHSWAGTHWSEESMGINPEHLDSFIQNQSLSELRRLARGLRNASDPDASNELKGRLLYEIKVALDFCPEVILELLLRKKNE